jgi:hypothetical protein
VKKHHLILFLACLVCLAGQSQNISGFWKGTLTMTGGCFPVNYIELQLTISGQSVTGDSYQYMDINNYIKKRCSGTYDPATKRIIVQEEIVTTYKIPERCVICIKRYELTYSKEGNTETLSGGWTGKIQDSPTECLPGTIVLNRIQESAFKSIPEVKVDTGTLKLDFYDNGQVDGDSITVKVNGKVVLSHQRLSGQAVTTYVRIDLDNPFQEIEMVAENLGSIPPNTAMLVITAGTKRYQLFLTSTESKSAVVRFVYDPPTAQQNNTVSF